MGKFHDLAEKVFGMYGFAGFSYVLDAVSEQTHVHICSNNYEQYKWDILDEAMKQRSYVGPVLMASIIHEIIGLNYDEDDLRAYYEPIP